MEIRKKGRHPLWNPQPYLQLSPRYRKTGTQVGDVGIITEDGAFDVMFNICGRTTRDESPNLPIGIMPIHPPIEWEKEVTMLAEHSARDTLTSRGISKKILYVICDLNSSACGNVEHVLGPKENLSSPLLSPMGLSSSYQTGL